MKKNTENALHTLCKITNKTNEQERLQGWQTTCQNNGFSGEFILSQKIGERAVSEEQIHMIAELFGR